MSLDPLPKSPQQFKQLTDAVTSAGDSKDLRLEPDAAGLAAQACAQMIANLKDAAHQVSRVASVGGLAVFDTDTQLKTMRLDKKGTGSDDSIDAIITKHTELVTKLRDLYIKAGKAYQDADFDGKQKFDHVDFDKLAFDRTSYHSADDTTTTEHLPVK